MKLIALPAFTDNCIRMLDAQQPVLAAILVTHHHADHVGGGYALRARLRGRVYGPHHEPTLPADLRQWKNDFR